jgi:hypothetical protein
MSTVANAEANKSVSQHANVFVSFMAVCASATLASAALRHQTWHRWEFLSLMVVAALTARLKLKLPGVNGNMAVSLPFILIAMTRLSLLEALLVAGLSVFTQSIPKAPNKFRLVHALFNVSTALLAAGLGWYAFHLMSVLPSSQVIALVVGCAVQYFVSTAPVAAIISLTEGLNPFRSWNDIVSLSFPYYLASTGLASMAASLGGNPSLPMLVGITLVMSVTYRSYRMYFGLMSSNSLAPAPKAQSAAAGK